MLVREIMVKSVLTATENTTLAEIAQVMVEQSIGCVPIVNDAGKLTGLITKSDLTSKDGGIPFLTFRSPHLLAYWVPSDGVEKMYAAAEERLAKEIMTRDVVTVTEYDSIQVVLRRMLDINLKRLPVVREGALVGIVTRQDLLRVINPQWVGVRVRSARVPGIY